MEKLAITPIKSLLSDSKNFFAESEKIFALPEDCKKGEFVVPSSYLYTDDNINKKRADNVAADVHFLDSIKTVGILKKVTAFWVVNKFELPSKKGEEKKYFYALVLQVLDGHRRAKACELLGMDVPIVVTDEPANLRSLQFQLNLSQRSKVAELRPMITELLKTKTIAEVALIMKLSTKTVSDSVKISSLEKEVLEAGFSDKALLYLTTIPAVVRKKLDIVRSKELTIDELTAMCQGIKDSLTIEALKKKGQEVKKVITYKETSLLRVGTTVAGSPEAYPELFKLLEIEE